MHSALDGSVTTVEENTTSGLNDHRHMANTSVLRPACNHVPSATSLL